jgi:Hg(II)-responsive transcriptional regulator
MHTLSIGKVAKMTGMTVEAIRFYEKRGLINAPERTPSGYRRYSPEAVKRICFIQHAKDAGFTLAEIAELLMLRETASDSCGLVKMRAENKLKDVEKRLNELRLVRNALTMLVARCNASDQMGECPILEALEPNDES